MEYRGAAVYNDDEFFENYLKRRNRRESPNNVIEKPVMMEMIGDVKGKKVLDLGCGDARFGVELLQKGCSLYEGVEGSEKMAEAAAKHLEGTAGKVHLSSLEEWNFNSEYYQLVVSRLVLHYIDDLKALLFKVQQSLSPNGEFIFSVQHPVLTSSMKSAEAAFSKTDWIVDDYFQLGKRTEPWIHKRVVKYHRTIEEYFQLLKEAGFNILDMREGTPRPEEFNEKSEYERRLRIPLFLMFSCKKTAAGISFSASTS